ncbi:hypothetical protein L798_06754 [Zootermopsis nevadensis]|uniref:Uncharacterized protein n=1 Tax=Zootermopsis nevadensis TaxID=136037 RepID=A0A067RKE7_ZOONE|nr:hypothetical protein L798_06754 [Zootermopsis nevadensis]
MNVFSRWEMDWLREESSKRLLLIRTICMRLGFRKRKADCVVQNTKQFVSMTHYGMAL